MSISHKPCVSYHRFKFPQLLQSTWRAFQNTLVQRVTVRGNNVRLPRMSCSEGFSPGSPVFLPPQKPKSPNSRGPRWKPGKANAPINVKPAGRGGGGGGEGGDLLDHFGPGVGHLNYLAVPGVGIFEFFSCLWPQIISRAGEFQLYLTSHFCPGVGNFTAVFGKMSKYRPMLA